MDLFAFPSYREAIPNAPLVAAAMQLPVIGTRISGNVDAIIDGETSTLVPVGDGQALAVAIDTYLEDPTR